MTAVAAVIRCEKRCDIRCKSEAIVVMRLRWLVVVVAFVVKALDVGYCGDFSVFGVVMVSVVALW